jgi:hypothetical protein
LGVVVLGIGNSLVRFEWNYDTLRVFKAAFYFPAGLYIGANWRSEPRDSAGFMKMFVIAAFLQSVRQIVYFDRFDVSADVVSTRTLRYFLSGLPVVFLIVRSHDYEPWRGWDWFYFPAIAFSTAGLILQQTRSAWIPQVLFCVLAVGSWLTRGMLMDSLKVFRSTIAMGLPIVLLLLAIGRYTSWNIDLFDLFVHGHAADFSDSSGRWEATQFEITEWFDGNLLIGNGLGYFTAPRYAGYEDMAWGHNGYIAYLSNLGLLGFLVYAILVPVAYFKAIRRLVGSGDPGREVMGSLGLLFLLTMVVGTMLSTGVLGGQFSVFLGFFFGYCHALGKSYGE